MRFVLDTNVLISGLFFSGNPGRILDWWPSSGYELVISPPILAEYKAVIDRLHVRYPSIDCTRLIQVITLRAVILDVPDLSESVCDDPTDDKFLACALAGQCAVIVSGDQDLLRHDGWQGIHVLRPADFVGESHI